MVYLFLCLSSKSDLTSQQLYCFKMCHPEKFHTPPYFSLQWSSCQSEHLLNEHLRTFVTACFLLYVRESEQILLLQDCCMSRACLSQRWNPSRQYMSKNFSSCRQIIFFNPWYLGVMSKSWQKYGKQIDLLHNRAKPLTSFQGSVQV